MYKKKVLTALSTSFLIWGCNSESSTSPTTPESKLGTAQVSIKSSQVGKLARMATTVADIELVKLILNLSAEGETSISDTTLISGNGATQVIREFNNLTPLKTWTVEATTIDSQDSIIHQGGTSFDVQPAQTTDVTLDLDAKYSMLKAEFNQIRDSVTSLHLFVDAVEVNTTTFASGTNNGTSVILDYDYLLADAPAIHDIKMQAQGFLWGLPYTLYEGDVEVVVTPGQDTSYVINLEWVGPGEPPAGQASMTVNLGNIGSVTVEGNFAIDPNSLSVNSFSGAFANQNWTFASSGAIAYNMSESSFDISSGGGGGGPLATITIPADGIISFDWAMTVFSAGQYGDNIYYTINGAQVNLSDYGTNNGAETGIAVAAGDVFALGSWGTTQSSSYAASFSNFTFFAN